MAAAGLFFVTISCVCTSFIRWTHSGEGGGSSYPAISTFGDIFNCNTASIGAITIPSYCIGTKVYIGITQYPFKQVCC